jgi:hypothetical protein
MCQQVRVEGVELTFRAYQKVHNYKGGRFVVFISKSLFEVLV